MAQIRLERTPTWWTDRFRAYKVEIDGAVVGEVRNGETKVFNVSPGRHRIQLRIDWATSRPVEVVAQEATAARLVCRGRSPFLALYSITLGRDNYLRLEQVSDT